MKDKVLLKNLTLVSKFMGADVTQPYPENDKMDQDGFLFYFGNDSILPPSIYKNMSSVSLKYHTSPDWLMPVFFKLKKLGLDWNINSKDVNVNDSEGKFSVSFLTEKDPMGAMFNSVVESVKYLSSK